MISSEDGNIKENKEQFLPNDIMILFESSKWEEKKEAMQKTITFISSNNNDTNLNNGFYIELYNYIKKNIKNFKETNINLIKESLTIFSYIITKLISLNENIKDICNELLNGFYDKITSKASDQIKSLFIQIEIVLKDEYMQNLFIKLKKEKKIPIIKEYASFFEQIINKNNSLGSISKNDIVSFCIMMANNANPQIRTSAINLLCLLYKFIGYELRKMICNEIKESTYKIIEGELCKYDNMNINNYISTTDIEESTNKGDEVISKGEEEKKDSTKVEFDIDNCLNLIDKGKWSEKKEAIENLHKEIENSTKEINYGEIINLLKVKLNDKQQKLVIMVILLFNQIIKKLQKKIKPFLNIITLPLLKNLNDNNDQIRSETIKCINTIVEIDGYEYIIGNIATLLKIDKFHLRNEILQFLLINKEKINKHKLILITEPLLLCLQDKNSEIREIAEQLIEGWADLIKIDEYYDKLSSFKPVIEENIKKILNKCYHIETKSDIPELSNTLKVSYNKSPNRKTSKDQIKLMQTINAKRPDRFSQSGEKTNRSKSKSPNRNKSSSKVKEDINPIYKKGVDFISLKEKRNEIDLKLKTNFISIKESNTAHTSNILTLFLTENFILSTINTQPLLNDKMQIFTLLSQKENFKENFYPNYDLILKYIIKEISLSNQSKNTYISLISFLLSFTEQLIICEHRLGEIESILTLELIINIRSIFNQEKDSKHLISINHLIKKIFTIIPIEKCFNIMIRYSLLCDNKTIKESVCNLFIEEISNGEIDIGKNIHNFALVIKFLYSKNVEVKEKGLEVFNLILQICGEEIFYNSIINNLNEQDSNLLLIHMGLSQKQQRKISSGDEKKNSSIVYKKRKVINESSSKTSFNSINSNSNSTRGHGHIASFSENPFEVANDSNNISVIKPQPKMRKNSRKKELYSEINNNDKRELIEILNHISSNESIANKEKLICTLNDMFTNIYIYENKKYTLLNLIDLIIQTLLGEVEKYIIVKESNKKIKKIRQEIINYCNNILSLILSISENKEIVGAISYQNLYKCSVILFNYLQIESDFQNVINSIMLNIIQQREMTNIVILLFSIADEYKSESDISLLAMNCIVNLTKNFNRKSSHIDFKAILSKFNDFNLDNIITSKYNSTDRGRESSLIKTIQKVLMEMIQIIGDKILIYYNEINENNQYENTILKEWINKILSRIKQGGKISLSSRSSKYT